MDANISMKVNFTEICILGKKKKKKILRIECNDNTFCWLEQSWGKVSIPE